MKKLFCTILCCCFFIPFFSCEKTQKIHLTTQNCSQYLNFNMYVTDFNDGLYNDDKPYISCIVHIETSKKIDCHFENVNISYTPHSSGSWIARQSITKQILTTADYNGKSHATYYCIDINPKAVPNLPNLDFTTDLIKKIEGYVILQG